MAPIKPRLEYSKAKRSFSLSDFDFQLLPELIAQQPAPERSSSKMLDG
jgi:S-adenosylmethionine:tRNA ribosyltransferase-isomerase